MILSEKFECTTDDLDFVIVSVAKEIENGYHIGKIELHDFHYRFDMKSAIRRPNNELDYNLRCSF